MNHLHIFRFISKCEEMWLVCVYLGGPKEGARSPGVGSWQLAGHAGQTDVLVHLQATELGSSHPSLLPQGDGGAAHEQVG